MLDQFSAKTLEIWQARSEDLDELHRLLYFALEPERLRHRPALLEALRSAPGEPLTIDRWVRLVDYRYGNAPLSSAGSLKSYGGRFSIGSDLDLRMGYPFPALYIGSDYETAFRERYQCEKGTSTDGLSAKELSLNVSCTSVFINGFIERVFDATRLENLEPICRILAKLSMPKEVPAILKRLNQPSSGVFMIRNSGQMRRTLQQNWRNWPVQFGIPSPSQQFGELVRAAGYEAILFKSTKGDGHCLAVFPDIIESEASFLALADTAPPEVKQTRLDLETAEELAGWHVLRPRDRPQGH